MISKPLLQRGQRPDILNVLRHASALRSLRRRVRCQLQQVRKLLNLNTSENSQTHTHFLSSGLMRTVVAKADPSMRYRSLAPPKPTNSTEDPDHTGHAEPGHPVKSSPALASWQLNLPDEQTSRLSYRTNRHVTTPSAVPPSGAGVPQERCANANSSPTCVVRSEHSRSRP